MKSFNWDKFHENKVTVTGNHHEGDRICLKNVTWEQDFITPENSGFKVLSKSLIKKFILVDVEEEND